MKVSETDRLQNADTFKNATGGCITHDPRRCGLAGSWLRQRRLRKCAEMPYVGTVSNSGNDSMPSSFQLIQNHLVEMLSNLTAMQTMVFRLSHLQNEGKLTDEHASLAKVFCSLRTPRRGEPRTRGNGRERYIVRTRRSPLCGGRRSDILL